MIHGSIKRKGRFGLAASCRPAFTLIELLLVMAVLAVVMALFLVAVQRVREAANRTACQNNIKQIGLALNNYTAAHGAYPPGSTNSTLPWGGPRTTWPIYLYPYLEQENISQKFDFHRTGPSGITWADNPNSVGPDAATATVIPTFLCPSDSAAKKTGTLATGTYAFSNYLAFFGDVNYGAGLPGATPANKRAAFGLNYGARPEDITDGLSNTMVVGEYLRGLPDNANDLRGMYWKDLPGCSQVYTQLAPNSPDPDALEPGQCNNQPGSNLPCSDASPATSAMAGSRSHHPGGVHVLLADGAVRFVSQDIYLPRWQALGTIASADDIDTGPPPAPPAPPPTASPPNTSPPPPPGGDLYIVVFNNTAGNPGTEAAQMAKDQGFTVAQVYSTAPKGFAAHIPGPALPALRKDSRVKYVEHDQKTHITVQTIPTGVRRILATQSHAHAGTGTGKVNSTIAIIDTGIDLNHPDLNVTFDKGFGFSNGQDDNGHGTHVAGIAAAKDNDVGVVGVAPGANLWALKALDSKGAGTVSDAIAALDFVATKASQVSVVNMSIGAPFDQGLNDAVDATVALGVPVVVAAGNESDDAANHSPGSAPGAIAVGALCDTDGLPGGLGQAGSFTDPDDTYASFSNFGATVAIIAPGEDIFSTWPLSIAPTDPTSPTGYNKISGTSMASPHVAGVVALIKDPKSVVGPGPNKKILNNRPVATATPNVTPAQIRQMLISAAQEQIPGINGEGLSYPLLLAKPF